MNIFHKIEHWLGWNHGVCDSFYKDGKLYMSFLCTGCGKRSDIHSIDDLLDDIISNPDKYK